jgi:hypothetical protein
MKFEPIVGRTNQVLQLSKHEHVSFNPSPPMADNGLSETALCIYGGYSILNGDHRCEVLNALNNGGINQVKKYFSDKIKAGFTSSWSN